MISESNSKVQNQIISSTLKRKITKTTDSTKTPLLVNQVRGKPLKININPKVSKEKTVIKSSDWKKIQTRYSLSQNVSTGIATMLRTATKNRKIIEPNLKQNLSDEIHSLDDFFHVKIFNFKIIKKNKNVDIEQPAVYCNNLNGLIEHLKLKRNIRNTRLQFGIDGGGGSLKICMSIQSTEDELEYVSEDEFELNRKKRQKYDNGVAANVFKDSGVKKLIILCLAPNVEENYHNVKLLWSEIKIDSMKGLITADIKLCNIMAGIMSSSSSFPCTYCDIAKENYLAESYNLRSIKNITENYNQWLNSGGNRKLARNYKCCISPPIFIADKNNYILDILAPPELHLLLGIVNGLFTHMSNKFEATALKWAKICNVERQVMYGGDGSFNGNDCGKLLNKLDILRNLCPLECLKFVQAFDDFKKVVKACFSNTLHPNYTSYIDDFKRSYLDLEIPITPKVHCVFVHIKEFCEKHKIGLGLVSEQAFESVHSEFKTIWIKHKVRPSHSEYDKHLLRAVCEFNGLHV